MASSYPSGAGHFQRPHESEVPRHRCLVPGGNPAPEEKKNVAQMARFRFRRYGRSSRRRWALSRRFKRRYGSNRRRGWRRGSRRGGINSTRSRTVRLAVQLAVPFTANYGTEASPDIHPIPLVFTPTQFPGFLDYASTYSEFRLLKASCKVHLALPEDSAAGAPLSNQPYTYVRTASRSFIERSATFGSNSQGGSPNSIGDILHQQPLGITELRQSRWQRQYYPSDIKNSLTFKFYPYTLTWTGRPVGDITNFASQAYRNSYLRYASGRRWMPMSFLGNPNIPADQPNNDVSFLGPYFVRLLSTLDDSQSLPAFQPVCTLHLWCQFRGQL